MHTSSKECNNKLNGRIKILLYPDCEANHSQNVKGSKLDQGPSFFQKDPTSNICISYKNNKSLAEVITCSVCPMLGQIQRIVDNTFFPNLSQKKAGGPAVVL